MSWFKDLSAGKAGENKAAQLLEQRGWNVEDVSQNKEYQQKDIDFIVAKDGIETTIEVKTDAQMARTGNFFIEIEQGNKKGWYYYCEAEFLFYLDSQNRIFHIFKFEDLREYMRTYNSKLRTASLKDGYRTIYGTLVSYSSFFSWLREQKKFNQDIEVILWH